MRVFAATSIIVFAVAVPGLACAAANATASERTRPSVVLKLSGAVVTKAADGRTMLTPVQKQAPKSGDDIEYDIAAMNVGTVPAVRLVSSGRIPAGTAYVEGSAKAAHAQVEFSLDGGRTWSSSPTIIVRRTDGSTIVKKADASLYTAVRFVTSAAIAAHQTANYAYDVRVK